jgi:hypothetical protein
VSPPPGALVKHVADRALHSAGVEHGAAAAAAPGRLPAGARRLYEQLRQRLRRAPPLVQLLACRQSGLTIRAACVAGRHEGLPGGVWCCEWMMRDECKQARGMAISRTGEGDGALQRVRPETQPLLRRAAQH